MKKRYLIIFLLITFIIEIFVVVAFVNKKISIKNDTVSLNRLTKDIEKNYGNEALYPTDYDYVIIDNNESMLYTHGNYQSTTINEAHMNNDIIIDLYVDDVLVGKLLVKNKINKLLDEYQNTMITFIVIMTVVQFLIIIGYYIYLYLTTIRPFKKLRGFAERVASGNLDIPLNMDKGNNFGAFTESFDIMRSELKKAKIAEMEAEKSKRELVARLSHDIKTPVASIMAISEVGMVHCDKDRDRFVSINQKADQINTLVSNLFTITIEELDELSVNPTKIPSYVIKELINNSDYLNRSNKFKIEECDVFFDRLRLQQVFDNIIMNSYKYANTNIDIESKIENEFLIISIKDFGDSIADDEIPLLFEKYRRGNNIKDKDGAGLGLYISKKFMEAMNVNIEIKNDKPGFKVLLYLRII